MSRRKITAKRCRDEVLKPYVRLFRVAVGPGFIFMNDKALCPCVILVDDFLDSKKIQRVHHFSDLYPTEVDPGQEVGLLELLQSHQKCSAAVLEDYEILFQYTLALRVQHKSNRMLTDQDWLDHHFIPEVERYCQSYQIPFKGMQIIDTAPSPSFATLSNFNPRVKVEISPPKEPVCVNQWIKESSKHSKLIIREGYFCTFP
ncbi:hypothetical protein TNCV_1069431 [Trichonephila clavipes]|nr:hypothetical protein TNCV_1069431 [Trichonephila clavipes]